ncbi:secretin N-terminal domain-containing protein [Chromobacterium amazonense]|uniref:secretin N-terminal domain-containing protein n=1 Tax=Chromobacterium amazonense TaxID=1382803 RepID=UPI003F79FC58
MMLREMGLLAACCLLGACSSTAYQGADHSVQQIQRNVEALNRKAAKPLPQEDTSVVPIHDGVYLASIASKRQSGQSLPVRFEKDGVRLMAGGPMSLIAIGDLISDATGIPVSFSEDVFGDLGKNKSKLPSSSLERSAGEAQAMADALDAAAQPNPTKSYRAEGTGLPYLGRPIEASQEKMRVNYRGPLSKFLNQTAAHFDVSWRYQGGRLQFSRLLTRSFQLAAVPIKLDGSTSLVAGMSKAGGGSGSGVGSGADSGGITAGATQTAKVDVVLDLWKELKDTLKTIIGGQGEFAISPSRSAVTVTAPASTMDRVARQVYQINKQLLRQVALKVEVYNVALTKDSNWQFDLGGALTAGAGVYAFGNASNPALAASGGISAAVIGGGKLNGSKAVLSLLEQKGDVTVLNTAAVTTMSGQPVPVQVSTTQSYLESLTSTSAGEGVVTVTPNVNTVNSGFSLNLLPKVMEDGKVLMQYSMNLSTLIGKDNGFDTYQYQSGGVTNTLKLPSLDQRSFIQSGLIDNGSTLVLAGYERLTNQTNDEGQGSPFFKLLGGGRVAKQVRDMLVVMITPVVLDHSAELAHLN